MRRLLTLMMWVISFSVMALDVEQTILKNGLKVLVKEDHRAPVAVVMVWYNIGSADEPGGLTGLSHALEHLMFKATTTHPQGMFAKTIAAAGGQINAFTNYDYTAYFEKIAASQLAVALELEADRMHNLIFDPHEFNRELNVVREERRLRTDDNPQALALERFLATAHLSEPYHHPVVGWMSDLNHLSLTDAKIWYQNFYAPNNATLVIAGDVHAAKVFKLAHLYFDNIKAHPKFIRKTQLEPPALGPKMVRIQTPAKVPYLLFGYTVPSILTSQKPWEPFALELIAGLLDIGDNARFASHLIRGGSIAGQADVYYNPYARFQTQFIFLGTPNSGHSLKQLKSVMLREIATLQNQPVANAELDRIKTQIIAQKTFEKDSLFGQAMELGLLETVGIGWHAKDEYQKNIQAITPEQIQEVAKRYFIPANETEAQLHPINQSENSR